MSKDLQQHVEQIAANIINGIKIEKEDIGSYDYDYELGDTLSGWDYIQDALDFRYLVDSIGNVIEVQILVAFGGPNIWVHLNSHGVGKVVGKWYLDDAVADIGWDAMGVFDAVCELRECVA